MWVNASQVFCYETTGIYKICVYMYAAYLRHVSLPYWTARQTAVYRIPGAQRGALSRALSAPV